MNIRNIEWAPWHSCHCRMAPLYNHNCHFISSRKIVFWLLFNWKPHLWPISLSRPHPWGSPPSIGSSSRWYLRPPPWEQPHAFPSFCTSPRLKFAHIKFCLIGLLYQWRYPPTRGFFTYQLLSVIMEEKVLNYNKKAQLALPKQNLSLDYLRDSSDISSSRNV